MADDVALHEVDHDPFDGTLTPVDHEPFLPSSRSPDMARIGADVARGHDAYLADQRWRALDLDAALHNRDPVTGAQLPKFQAVSPVDVASDYLGEHENFLAGRDAEGNAIADKPLLERAKDIAGYVAPYMTGGGPGTVTAGGLKPIRAYHGSPHDFDTFDLGAIGTGEGAQAYGHGLYFAENPKVAASYKQEGARWRLPNGELTRDGNDAGEALYEHAFRDYKAEYGGVSDAIRDQLYFAAHAYAIEAEALPPMADGMTLADYHRHLKTPGVTRTMADNFNDYGGLTKDGQRGLDHGWIADIAASAERHGFDLSTSKGHMYEVDLNADPSRLLDLDSHVQHDETLDAVRSALEKAGITRDALATGGFKGTTIRDELTRAFARQAGLTPQAAAPLTTNALQEGGLQGFRYLDSFSRTKAGQGSSNFVIFNPEIVEILKKYGIAGAVGAGALAELEHDPFETK